MIRMETQVGAGQFSGERNFPDQNIFPVNGGKDFHRFAVGFQMQSAPVPLREERVRHDRFPDGHAVVGNGHKHGIFAVHGKDKVKFFADARFRRDCCFGDDFLPLDEFGLCRLGGDRVRGVAGTEFQRAVKNGQPGQHCEAVVEQARLCIRLDGRPDAGTVCPDRIVEEPEPGTVSHAGNMIVIIAEIFKEINSVAGLDEGDRFFQIQTGGIGRAGRKKQQCAEQTAGQQGACG